MHHPNLAGATVDEGISLATDEGGGAVVDGSLAETTVDVIAPPEDETPSAPLQVEAPLSPPVQDKPMRAVTGSASVEGPNAVAMVASASTPVADECVGVSTEGTGVSVPEGNVDEPEATHLLDQISMVAARHVSAAEPLMVAPAEAPAAVIDEGDVEPTVEVKTGKLLVYGALIL